MTVPRGEDEALCLLLAPRGELRTGVLDLGADRAGREVLKRHPGPDAGAALGEVGLDRRAGRGLAPREQPRRAEEARAEVPTLLIDQIDETVRRGSAMLLQQKVEGERQDVGRLRVGHRPTARRVALAEGSLDAAG